MLMRALFVRVCAGPKRFVPGTKVSARILFVHPGTKAIGLGLSKHLVSCTPYEPPLPLATPLRTSYEVVLKAGALMNVASTEAADGGAVPTAAFGAWLAKGAVADLRERQTAADALKKLKPGGVAKGVVLGYRWLDGLLDVSTRPSALGERWMT